MESPWCIGGVAGSQPEDLGSIPGAVENITGVYLGVAFTGLVTSRIQTPRTCWHLLVRDENHPVECKRHSSSITILER